MHHHIYDPTHMTEMTDKDGPLNTTESMRKSIAYMNLELLQKHLPC